MVDLGSDSVLLLLNLCQHKAERSPTYQLYKKLKGICDSMKKILRIISSYYTQDRKVTLINTGISFKPSIRLNTESDP